VKRVVDYDPYTGITTTFDYTPDGVTVVGREQDVSAILDLNKAMANDEDYTKKGIKSGWWRYGTIPNIVQEKWLNEHGVNIWNKDHWPAVFRLLNSPEYRYLKTTTKFHEVRHG
jgi:hypothetical protein